MRTVVLGVGLLPLQVKRLGLLLRKSRLLLRWTLRKKKKLARLLCRRLFFSVVVVCIIRLLNPDVMEREVAYCPLV